MHQNFLKEARLGTNFDSVGRLFQIIVMILIRDIPIEGGVKENSRELVKQPLFRKFD